MTQGIKQNIDYKLCIRTKRIKINWQVIQNRICAYRSIEFESNNSCHITLRM